MENTKFKLLEKVKLTRPPNICSSRSTKNLVRLDSPASEVLTDFRKIPAETLTTNTLATTALTKMQINQVKSLLIEEKNKIIGMITSKDIQDIKAGAIAQKLDINMSDLTVNMLMTSFDNLISIQDSVLSNARVGHIVQLMRHNSVNHCIVVKKIKEKTEDKFSVVGIFSAARISRQLGADLYEDLHARNLKDLYYDKKH